MVNLSYHIRASKNDGFEAGTRKLVVEAGHRQLCVLLWNKEQNLLEGAEVFTGIQDWVEAWTLMLQQSTLLHLKHLETEVFMNSERFLPVPAVFFEPIEMSAQVNAFFGELERVHDGGDVHAEKGMVIVWQAPNEILEILNNHFNLVQTKSMASLLLNLEKSGQSSENQGYLVVSGNLAWISIFRSGELLLIRAIDSKEPDNVAYFLLNACQTWGIGPDQIHWQVGGLIETDSPLWLAAERFFPNFEPMEGSPLGGEMPSHFMAHFARYLS